MGRASASLILKEGEVRKMATRILLRYFKTVDESAQELLDDTDCIIELSPQRISRWSY